MIEGLQRFFNTYLVSPTESDETKAPMRLNLAAAALLFEVARSDYDLGSEEQALIESGMDLEDLSSQITGYLNENRD